MKKTHNKGKQKLNKKLRQEILSIFSENPNKTFNYKQLSNLLSITDKQIKKLIFGILDELAQDEFIFEIQRGRYRNGKKRQTVEGIISVSRKGDGFVISDEIDEDLFIPAKFLSKVMHGDKVTAVVKKHATKSKKAEGEILSVIDRNTRKIVGTLDVQSKYAFLVPDDPRINVDIFIPIQKLNGGRDGHSAVAIITDWPESAKNPFGEIIENLGDPHSNDSEMKAILLTCGIEYDFSEEVLNEANQISTVLTSDEIALRRDFRDVLTFTIDPVDAKDFDDALSVEIIDEDRIRVGIHIADVGHYIAENSQLDKEAFSRGNSVYLVDRVIPMLPEHLSNGVCSLRPNEEKYTFSAVFDLSMKGEVHNEWFGKTVICSDRRFTYEDAQSVIEKGKGDHANEILIIDKIAKNLRADRLRKGALEIQSSETRFELDNHGFPINIYKKTMADSNKLIEEFMLLANKKVGKFIGNTRRKTAIPFIYRIHDKPDKQKVEQFRVFVSKFEKSFNFENDRDIALQMNALFKEFEGQSEFALIQQMAIKSMAKAVYDTENIGHYGLGFTYYAHFTSPIRRYADLMVHRILHETLEKKNKRHAGLADTAKHISFTERKAVDAERASKKYFQAKYLENQIGEAFKGSITGLTEWGIYVEMEENFCEGMVPLRSLKDDRYFFDEQEFVIVGKKTGNTFNIGDILFVKVANVSLAKKQIDLEIFD